MTSPETNPDRPALSGLLHLFVAFDIGDEVDLEHASRLAPSAKQGLPRRKRTPISITFHPPPLRFSLGRVELTMPGLGQVRSPAEATLFDFAGVSVDIEVPFQLSPEELLRLTGWLANPVPVVETARNALRPLYQRLQPSIKDPWWADDLSEEYFVFQLPPGALGPVDGLLTGSLAGWLAGLLRLEEGPLSDQEVNEALRLWLRYGPDDFFVPDWGIAVLLDQDCEETLLTIEYTNLQLLEYRHIDHRLDASVASAYRLIEPVRKSWLPFWRTYSRTLQALGQLNMEANELFERTGNVFKLVGDQYLARVHHLLARRFHLGEWEQIIRRKLNVLQKLYETLSDQAVAYRGEVLELVIVVLILIEIILTLVRH
jgi:hypothetical protein